MFRNEISLLHNAGSFYKISYFHVTVELYEITLESYIFDRINQLITLDAGFYVVLFSKRDL